MVHAFIDYASIIEWTHLGALSWLKRQKKKLYIALARVLIDQIRLCKVLTCIEECVNCLIPVLIRLL